MTEPTPPPARDRRLAAACFAGIVICILMTALEISRAIDGNGRALGYVFQWPAFAVFIAWMWRRLSNRPSDDDHTPSSMD